MFYALIVQIFKLVGVARGKEMSEIKTCHEVRGSGGGEDEGYKFLCNLNHSSIVMASYSRRLESPP
jgi:hypothetical protein